MRAKAAAAVCGIPRTHAPGHASIRTADAHRVVYPLTAQITTHAFAVLVPLAAVEYIRCPSFHRILLPYTLGGVPTVQGRGPWVNRGLTTQSPGPG